MMQFDRISLGRQAKELGFVRDTFEIKEIMAREQMFGDEIDKIIREIEV